MIAKVSHYHILLIICNDLLRFISLALQEMMIWEILYMNDILGQFAL